MTIDAIMSEMTGIVDGAEGRSLTDDEVARYEDLEGQLQAAQRDSAVRARQAAYETPAAGAVPVGARSDSGSGVSSLMPDRQGLSELRSALNERRATRVATPISNAAVTTTETGQPASPLGVTPRGGPRRIAELAGIGTEQIDWGGTSQFPILAAGTAPGATAEGALKPEFDGVTPGTADPQTLATWTDLSNQALSIPNLELKLRNKLARLVASGENELLRSKVSGTTGVVTQTASSGDQAVQILRSASIIEANLNERPDLMLFNPGDTATIFGTAVSNAAPAEIAELSISLFGMLALPLNTQPAGFVLMGAWSAGSRLVVGLSPTFATDPVSQMKNNLTTVLLEEAVDLAVEEPDAFRIVDIVV